MYVRMYVCMYVCMYIYIYIYIYGGCAKKGAVTGLSFLDFSFCSNSYPTITVQVIAKYTPSENLYERVMACFSPPGP